MQLAGGSVNGSIMSFLMQSLMHCVDTTMPAGIKRAGSLQWPRKAMLRGEPNGGPSCGRERAETSLFVLAATPEGRSTAAGCTLESGRLLSGHMYLCGVGAKCKRATLLGAAAHGCSREAWGEGKQSRHAPLLRNLAAQILGLVEPGELHLQWAASSLSAGAPP